MSDRFADLDELVLRCRDREAREYIREAVACYRGGAFRSCIVAAWIAVVFDFIHKLKDLELFGDKNAISKLESFRKARSNKDIAGSLQFERQVLDLAEREFEFISPVEREDLERLYRDRNRCAHATMTLEETVFSPSAELARTHLRTAVEDFLCHPATQGKQAVDFLVGRVLSAYFPLDVDDAVSFFNRTPLARARESLVRNFIVVLAKTYVFGELEDDGRARFACALNAVRTMYPEMAKATYASKLSGIYRRELADTDMGNATHLLISLEDVADCLAEDALGLIQRYVEDLPTKECGRLLANCLDVQGLRQQAVNRIEKIQRSEIEDLMGNSAFKRSELVVPCLRFYEGASSFDSANQLARACLIPLVEHFTEADVRHVFEIANVNDQVLGSFVLFFLLEAAREIESLPIAEFDSLVNEYRLPERCSWTRRPGEPQETHDDIPF